VSAATLSYGRREPALGPSLALSALTHAVLIAVLFFGVRFQSSTPATVEVELWEPPPPAPPAPVIEQPKPPPPPPPVVKPEPEPEVKKPDIALPERPKPKPKPEPKKVEAKPKPKPEPKRDLAFEKQMREQAMREEQQLEAQAQERQMRELIARQQAAATQKALATWTDKIRAKIRGNIILPHDLPGNPEAIFDVALLPSGEVLTVRKRKSSGHAGYDDAVERAIMKSSPLPLPDDRSVFRRDLELKFRPQDR
jgi:colicin import membrane protein